MVKLECVDGIVEEAKESKNKTGWNYKIGGKWFFADKRFQPVEVGRNIRIEFESVSRDDGRVANFISSLHFKKVDGVVDQVPPGDVDLLKCILLELREIKELLRK